MGRSSNAWFPNSKYLLIDLPEITDFIFKGAWTEQHDGTSKLDI